MGPATRAAGIDVADEFADAARWFARTLSRTSTDTPVPTCPGWSVLDLAVHLGNVHLWAATVLESGRAERRAELTPGSTRPRRVARWYEAVAHDLYTVLRGTPVDQPCWNFAYGVGVAGFWHRRMMHETLMHGVDLAVAADVEERLPPSLAADGVDEALTVFLHRMHSRGHPADLVAPIVLRATDTGQTWSVEPGVRGAAIPQQSSPPDARVDGADRPEPRVVPGQRKGYLDVPDLVEAPAAVLLKVLWKRARVTDPQLRVVGDEDRVRRFLTSRLTP